jgi:hypothetical protein
MTVKTWWTTIQIEYREESKTESQQQSEEEYLTMSSRRTSADDSGFETGAQDPTNKNSDGSHESHTPEQLTTEVSKNENATEDLAPKNTETNSSTGKEDDKKDSPISESTPTKPPATKKSRKRKADVGAPSDDTPTKKQKTAFSGIKNAPDLDPDNPSTITPPAKTPRKRKAADDTATEGTPAKRQRKTTAKAADAADAAASAPKPRKAGKNRKKDDCVAMPPPPPPPPVPVLPQVATKLQQVRDFIQTYPADMFDHKPLFPRAVTLPERNLSGILATMYWHWQVEVPLGGVLSEIKDRIVYHFQQELGTDRVPADMVTVDITNASMLEARIQETILRHGLEGKSLLYVEMKMFDANLEARSGFFTPEVERLLDAVADGADEEAKSEQGDPAAVTSSPLSSPLTNESGDMQFGVHHPPMQKV